MGLYRWGNGVVVSSMLIALLLKANESNDKSCLQSVFGGVLVSANVVMVAANVIQSVLLAETWRGSMAAIWGIAPLTGTRPPCQVAWNRSAAIRTKRHFTCTLPRGSLVAHRTDHQSPLSGIDRAGHMHEFLAFMSYISLMFPCESRTVWCV